MLKVLVYPFGDVLHAGLNKGHTSATQENPDEWYQSCFSIEENRHFRKPLTVQPSRRLSTNAPLKRRPALCNTNGVIL